LAVLESMENGKTVREAGGADVDPAIDAFRYYAGWCARSIRGKRFSEKPYWDVERARIGDTRAVPVEPVVNGEVVARKTVPADGQVRAAGL
jgi:acyl-CoA reductase-like NAD-dependent aldehyde dehydrogenase